MNVTNLKKLNASGTRFKVNTDQGKSITIGLASADQPSAQQVLNAIYDIDNFIDEDGNIDQASIDYSTLAVRPGITVEEYVAPSEQDRIESLKKSKRNKVRADYESDLNNVPVQVNGIDWDCLRDSPIMLNGELEYAQKIGADVVVFFDFNNRSHSFSLSEAEEIIIGVATEFRARYAKKQTLMVAIDNATTKTKLEAISYV